MSLEIRDLKKRILGGHLGINIAKRKIAIVFYSLHLENKKITNISVKKLKC